MNFKGKTVLVTGAASGIGKMTALTYGEKGAKVVVSDVNTSSGKEVAKEITSAGGEAIFVEADVADFDSVSSLVETTIRHFDRIDIAVNNAGIGSSRTAKTDQHGLNDWDKVLAVNQTGVFYCMKLELQQMLKQQQGTIINIASVAGLKGLPNNLAYTASKHAVVGMTKAAALEYARKNIRINAVCPVFTHSPMLEQLFASKEGLREKLVHTIPMGRYGKPSEITNTILWLSSEEASFITGQSIAVDGGMMA
ncbi:MAG: glucose 1-dehydrogenase [Bacteroidota bacterium]